MTITMAITMTPALFRPLEVSRVHFTKREGNRKKEKRMRTNTVVWKGKNERKKKKRKYLSLQLSDLEIQATLHKKGQQLMK